MRASSRLPVGIGYRRALHDALLAAPEGAIDFVELAPENYVGLGGDGRRRLRAIQERYPIITHGLSMSLGGDAPLDPSLMADLEPFLRQVRTPWHSDHLCWSKSGDTHFHELLPIAFTDSSVDHVAARVREAMARLPVPLAIENVSAYARHAEDTLDEGTFVSRVVEAAGCKLLLDVNNVYVNAHNFGGDARAALAAMPLEAAVQIHIAGFARESPQLVIDTHGAPVDEGVWSLLELALERTGPVPVLLERDHQIPPLPELLEEVARIRAIGARVLGGAAARTWEAGPDGR